jgi:hypothetical protein
MRSNAAVRAGAGTLLVLVLSACTGSGSASSGAAAPTGAAGATPTSAAPFASASGGPASTTRTTSRPPVAPSPVTGSPSVAISTAPPVPVGSSAALAPDIQVTVAAPRVVKVAARGPGEIAGSALVVTVTVRNVSGAPFDLGGLAVNASYGKGTGTPAPPTEADPYDPLKGRLAAGGSAKGQYVFTAPATAASTLRVEVSSNASARILVFRS